MPDDTDQVDVRPPPSPAIPAGSGYTYSTPGPADWRAPVTAPGPGGVSVPLPANVQGFAAVQGAPGPSPQVQQDAAMQDWMNTVFRKLPIQEAFAAIEAANKFQGQRIYQRMLESGKSSGEALAAAGPLLFGGGANNLTGLANYIKALRPPQMTPYQQAQIDVRRQQLAPKPITPFQERELAVREGELKRKEKEGEAKTTAKEKLSVKDLTNLLTVETDPARRERYQAALDAMIEQQMPKPAAPAKGGRKPFVNEIIKGYRFKGGDPSKKTNWEKVQAQAAEPEPE